MRRRPFLALLGVGLAGCSATDPSTETPRSTETATETPTDTPSETATDTPTETATDTPTDTPSAAQRQAQEAISAVQSTLGAVVEQYRGDAGQTILAADASYTDFQDRTIDNALVEAKAELQTAREAAVTEAQRQTVADLATTRQFLQTAAETQVWLVGAYFHVQEVRRAVAAEQPGEADDELDRVATQRRLARAPYRTLTEETSTAATRSLAELDAETYRAKRAQFEAEMTAFGDLQEPVSELIGGVRMLEAALALQQNGSTSEARTQGERAVTRFESAAQALSAFADGLDTPADALVGVGRSLSALADEKAAATRERIDLDETTGEGSAG